MWSSARALLTLSLVYIGARGAVLWTAFDSVSMPQYELNPVGNLARLLASGWRGPGLAAHYDNCGGHLSTGMLAALPHALLADAYWTLKLVPLALGLVCLALVWSLLGRAAGRPAAFLGALLFALPPPTLFKYSLLAKGNHFESLAPQLLALWCFQRMHDSPRPERWRAALALVLGLATSAYLGSLLWLPILLVVHIARRGPRATARDLVLGLPPFLLGLAPLLWLHARTAGRPLRTLESFLTPELSGEGVLGRVVQLASHLPRAGLFPDLGPVPGAVADAIALGTFVVAWTLGAREVGAGFSASFRALRHGPLAPVEELRRTEALRLAPLVLHLPALALAWSLSSLRFTAYKAPVEVGQYRYLVPHFAVAALLVGAMAGRWRHGRWLAGAALVPALFLLPLVDWSLGAAGHGRAYPGSSLPMLGRVLVSDALVREVPGGPHSLDTERLVHHLLEFPPSQRPEVARGVGRALAYRSVTSDPRGLDSLDPRSLAKPFPESLRPEVARGVGACLRELSTRRRREVAQWLQGLGPQDALAAAVVEGLALGYRDPLERELPGELRLSEQLHELVPVEWRPSFHLGRGQMCGRVCARGLQPDRARSARVANGLRGEAIRAHAAGFGRGWAEFLRTLPPVEIAQFDHAARDAARESALRVLSAGRAP